MDRYKYHIITLVLGVIYFWFITITHDNTYGDHEIFSSNPINIMYGVERWFDWSSRLLIESAANIFAHYLPVWQIVTVIMGAVMFWSVGRIIGNTRVWESLLLISLMALVNFYILNTAGVFATTINYLWPLASFLYVVAMIVKPFSNRKLRLVANIVSIPLIVFAVCNEQVAVLAFIFSIAYIGCRWINRAKVSKLVWFFLVMSIIGVVNVLISPGNESRSVDEVENWFPGFDQYSLWSKLLLGAIVTLSRIFMAPELPVIIMPVLLLALAYKRANSMAIGVSIPSVIMILLLFFPNTEGMNGTYIAMTNFFNELRVNSILLSPSNLPSFEDKVSYFVVFAVILSSLISSIYFIYGKTQKTLIILIALASGLLVALAVSLSPTIFASTTRTIYPLMIIVVAVDCVIIKDLVNYRVQEAEKLNSKNRPINRDKLGGEK